MTARDRLTRTRAVLAGTALVSALLWTVSVGLVVYGSLVAVAVAGARWVGFGTALALAVAAGLAVGGTLLWRWRHAWSRARVALWIEEHAPVLRYALVTADEQQTPASAGALEARVAAADWRPEVRRSALRTAGAPLLVLLASAVALVVLPALRRPLGAASRAPAGRLTDDGSTAAGATRLSPLAVTVDPPAYTGRGSRRLSDPAGIPALTGSRIRITGPGSAAGLEIRLGDRVVAAREAGADWRADFTMPARAMALRLTTAAAERLIVLEPLPDSLPRVTLLRPARDTILRDASGEIAVSAEAHDDFGLARLRLEYIVSSGQGETFTFSSGVLAERTVSAVDATIGATVRLAELKAGPGDIIHLRAVAGDRNDVSGPGTGYSETRMIRIARPDEYDSLSIEPLPPLPSDTALLSQRMLILLAERLEAARPRLVRDTVVAESRRIGADQARLRRQVGEIIFMRLGGEASAEHSHEGESPEEHAGHAPPEGRLTPEQLLAAAEAATNQNVSEALDFHGDETPVVAINRPLLDAYNAMWDAGRELNIGEPDDALPHMRAALAAIQRARQAERIYLRGRAPAVIVDLARVRLAGKRDGVEPARVDRGPASPAAVLRQRRFSAALERLAAGDPSAADTLALLRLDALSDAPALATAIGAAIDDLRASRDATDALVTVRRLIGGTVRVGTTLPLWSGSW